MWIRGLFLEGAGWDKKNACLIEAEPMQLVCRIPTIHFKPVENKKKSGKGNFAAKSSANHASSHPLNHPIPLVVLLFTYRDVRLPLLLLPQPSRDLSSRIIRGCCGFEGRSNGSRPLDQTWHCSAHESRLLNSPTLSKLLRPPQTSALGSCVNCSPTDLTVVTFLH